MSRMTGRLPHRCDVYRTMPTIVDGILTHNWAKQGTLECRLDLGLIRKGKDTGWISEAGRPADRAGVLFTQVGVDIKAGDQIRMTAGPSGKFGVKGPIDEAQNFAGVVGHWEIAVEEEAQLTETA